MSLSQADHIAYILRDDLSFDKYIEVQAVYYIAIDWNSGIRVRIQDTGDSSVGLVMCGEDTDEDDSVVLSPDSDEAAIEIMNFIRQLFNQGAPGRAQHEKKFLNQSVYSDSISPQDVAFRAIELYGIDSFCVSPVDHSVDLFHEHGDIITIYFERNDDYEATKWNIVGYDNSLNQDIISSGNIENYDLTDLHHVIISWSRVY